MLKCGIVCGGDESRREILEAYGAAGRVQLEGQQSDFRGLEVRG